jgi:maltose O-acetyltransferase
VTSLLNNLRAHERFHAYRDRLRARLLHLKGARVAARTRIARGCVVHRPWCVAIGRRCQFEHNVYIKPVKDSARIQLGDDVFIGFNGEFDISESLYIGNGALIAPGCFITDHVHGNAAAKTIASQRCVSKPVRIEDDVWLGAHAIVLPGVTVGRGAIVGAGAVVTQNVAPMTIVAGVPARLIGLRD